MRKQVVTGLAVMMLASGAFAKTNVDEKVAQLKENKEASKDNLKQYEDNLKNRYSEYL